MHIQIAAHKSSCAFLYLFLVMLMVGEAFRSVDEYYFNIGNEEKLRDVHLIPDGEEVTIFLFKEESQSYFFPLDGPVTITTTPCSSTVEWKVFYHSLNPEKVSSGLEGDPLHIQEREYQRNAAEVSSFTSLYAYQGKEMSSYRTNHEHLLDGYLRIVLTAKEENGYVKIIVTDAQEADSPFPQLPTSSNIDIIANDRNYVTVTWKPSPSSTLKGYRIKYCIAFNPRQNYHTLCSLKEALEGQQPPLWPRNTGFGFATDALWRKRISHVRKNNSKNLKTKRDIYFECVGGRQWATVNSLLPSKRYYVNVFAIDEYTNRSVAYSSKTFVTKPTNDVAPTLLLPGVVYTFHLDDNRNTDVLYRSYRFQLKADVIKSVAVFVQGCQPQITTEVIYEGVVIVKDVKLINVQKILLKQADAGNYTLRFKLDNLDPDLSRQIKVCYMYNSEKCTFNAAPSDYRLIVKNKNITSCHKPSLSVQWTSAANFNVRYCLSARQVQPNNDDYEDYDTDYTEERCERTPSQIPLNERLFCKQYKRNSPHRNGKQIKDTLNVVELEANKVYRFHMQAMLRGNITIDYDSTDIRITNNC